MFSRNPLTLVKALRWLIDNYPDAGVAETDLVEVGNDVQALIELHENELDDSEPILQFFTFGHLPAALREVSRPFGLHARFLVKTLPKNDQRTQALYKLLEAKDAAVRARLAQ